MNLFDNYSKIIENYKDLTLWELLGPCRDPSILVFYVYDKNTKGFYALGGNRFNYALTSYELIMYFINTEFNRDINFDLNTFFYEDTNYIIFYSLSSMLYYSVFFYPGHIYIYNLLTYLMEGGCI